MEKFSKRLIPYYFTVSFIGIIFFCYFAFASVVDSLGEEDFYNNQNLIIIGILIAFVILVITSLVYSIFYYKKASYTISKDKIKCIKGLFIVKNSILDYSKIQSIYKKTYIIQRLFKITTIHISSASANTPAVSEISIIVDSNLADNIIKTIENYKAGINEDEEKDIILKEEYQKLDYKISFINYLIISIINSIPFIILSSIVFIPIAIFTEEQAVMLPILLAIIIIIAILFLFSNMARFYKFEISYNDSKVKIVKGLFSRGEIIFDKTNLKAIKVKQNLLYRLFSRCSVSLSVIGYVEQNNDSTVDGYILPICKYNEAVKYLNLIFKDHNISENKEQAKDFKAFICLPFLSSLAFLTVNYLIAIVVVSQFYTDYLYICHIVYLSLLLIRTIFLLINAYLAYKQQGIEILDDQIIVHFGGFNKQQETIKIKDLVSVETITTHFRLKKGVISLSIQYYSNALSNKVIVENIDSSYKDKIEQLLNY